MRLDSLHLQVMWRVQFCIVLFPLLIFQYLEEIIEDLVFFLLCKGENGMFIYTINKKAIVFENIQVIRVDE